MIKKLQRLFHTLKYLKPTQLAFFIIRRKFPAKSIEYSGSPLCRSRFVLSAANTVTNTGIGKQEFRFLNIDKNFSAEVDWAPEDVPRLWRYNLHYFDYLRDEGRSNQDKLVLILDWIDNNPQGTEPGWEPFTASLRVVNWIFFLQQYPQAKTKAVLQSLYTQVLWLEKNDERHILANHYFENLKALVFAGGFFDGMDAERWRKRAIKELIEQFDEQILSDGGHYERTPQYHGLMLENFLDLYNLTLNNPDLFPVVFTDKCFSVCEKALAFMRAIVFPDNNIPLFNDSAFGISPSVDELAQYFQRLSGRSESRNNDIALVEFPDSGLFGYRAKNNMVIFDAGEIGPSYQPGHTHCDMLSFELMWGGERIVVDSGVSEYEPGEMRQYVRSTRAHNTVSVDAENQSEVWGEFRVARRASVLNANIAKAENRVGFSGAYRGFPVLGGKIVHQRHADLELGASGAFSILVVSDQVTGTGSHRVESFIHLHPDIQLSENGSGCLLITTANGQQFELSFADNINYYREQGFYCPQFGVKIPNIRIVLSLEGQLPAKLSYSITKIN